MDTNKPLSLVLVVLTKLHATGKLQASKSSSDPAPPSAHARTAAEQSAGTGTGAEGEKGVFSPGNASLKQF